MWGRSDYPRSMYQKAVAGAEGWSATPPFLLENLLHHFATWANASVTPTNCSATSWVTPPRPSQEPTSGRADTIPQGVKAFQCL